MDEIKNYIDYAVQEVVQQLRANGLINERLPINQKAEELLKNYHIIEQNSTETFDRLRDALDELEHDEYIDVINLIYLGGYTILEVAEEFGVSERTVKRHKRRLLYEIGKRVFTEDWIAGVIR